MKPVIGISTFRAMNGEDLRTLSGATIIRDIKSDKPIAVLLPYATYLEMQQKITQFTEELAKARN